jgi:hypothetical protein
MHLQFPYLERYLKKGCPAVDILKVYVPFKRKVWIAEFVSPSPLKNIHSSIATLYVLLLHLLRLNQYFLEQLW